MKQEALYPHIATPTAKAGVAAYYARPRPWNRPAPEAADSGPAFDLDGYTEGVAATHGNAGSQQVRPAGGEWWEAANLTAQGERI